jgi:hypothetical protein
LDWLKRTISDPVEKLAAAQNGEGKGIDDIQCFAKLTGNWD